MKKYLIILVIGCLVVSCKHRNTPNTEEPLAANWVNILKFENPDQQRYVLARCTDEWVFPIYLGAACESDSLFLNPYIDLVDGYVMVNSEWQEAFLTVYSTNYQFIVDGVVENKEMQMCYLPDYEWPDDLLIHAVKLPRTTTKVEIINPFLRYYTTMSVETTALGELVNNDKNSREYRLRYYDVGMHYVSCEKNEDQLFYIDLQHQWKSMMNQIITDNRLAELHNLYF